MKIENIRPILLLLLLFFEISGRHFFVIWDNIYFVFDVISWVLWFFLINTYDFSSLSKFIFFVMAIWGISSQWNYSITDKEYFIVDAVLWCIAFTPIMYKDKGIVMKLSAIASLLLSIMALWKEVYIKDTSIAYNWEYMILAVVACTWFIAAAIATCFSKKS